MLIKSLTQKGFAPVVIIIIGIVVASAGIVGGAIYVKNNNPELISFFKKSQANNLPTGNTTIQPSDNLADIEKITAIPTLPLPTVTPSPKPLKLEERPCEPQPYSQEYLNQHESFAASQGLGGQVHHEGMLVITSGPVDSNVVSPEGSMVGYDFEKKLVVNSNQQVEEPNDGSPNERYSIRNFKGVWQVNIFGSGMGKYKIFFEVVNINPSTFIQLEGDISPGAKKSFKFHCPGGDKPLEVTSNE